MSPGGENACPKTELVHGLALSALAAADEAEVAIHLQTCDTCRRDLQALRPVVASFSDWPTDVVRPSMPLWDRLAERIASDSEARPRASSHRSPPRMFPWKDVAPGLSCKLLATDLATDRVSMLVRLSAGVGYPPHRHAGVEELYLLAGELFIDDEKLYPGDYHIAQPGTSDARVWSQTGCTCVLITSLKDQLR